MTRVFEAVVRACNTPGAVGWALDLFLVDSRNTQLARRNLLGAAAGGHAARLAAQSEETAISPRIIATTASASPYAEFRLHVALTQFALPSYAERMRQAEKPVQKASKGSPPAQPTGRIIGSPLATSCSAFLLVRTPAAALSHRGVVMAVVLHPERHEWTNAWAVDLVWDEHTRRWLFTKVDYGRSEVRITIFDPTGMEAFGYPLSFTPSYASPWPDPPPSLPGHVRKFTSRLDRARRVWLLCLKDSLVVTVAHDDSQFLVSRYDRRTEQWSDLPDVVFAGEAR